MRVVDELGHLRFEKPKYPEKTAIAMIVATILAMSTLVFTISLLLNIALGVIAAAGCAHYLLTDGGAVRFYCSRFGFQIF